MQRAGKQDAVRADTIPVFVRAHVADVLSPSEAFAAITRDFGRRDGIGDPVANGESEYTFTYAGIKHDVRLTQLED